MCDLRSGEDFKLGGRDDVCMLKWLVDEAGL